MRQCSNLCACAGRGTDQAGKRIVAQSGNIQGDVRNPKKTKIARPAVNEKRETTMAKQSKPTPEPPRDHVIEVTAGDDIGTLYIAMSLRLQAEMLAALVAIKTSLDSAMTPDDTLRAAMLSRDARQLAADHERVARRRPRRSDLMDA